MSFILLDQNIGSPLDLTNRCLIYELSLLRAVIADWCSLVLNIMKQQHGSWLFHILAVTTVSVRNLDFHVDSKEEFSPQPKTFLLTLAKLKPFPFLSYLFQCQINILCTTACLASFAFPTYFWALFLRLLDSFADLLFRL